MASLKNQLHLVDDKNTKLTSCLAETEYAPFHSSSMNIHFCTIPNLCRTIPTKWDDLPQHTSLNRYATTPTRRDDINHVQVFSYTINTGSPALNDYFSWFFFNFLHQTTSMFRSLIPGIRRWSTRLFHRLIKNEIVGGRKTMNHLERFLGLSISGVFFLKSLLTLEVNRHFAVVLLVEFDLAVNRRKNFWEGMSLFEGDA